jgi:hypothetical protein
LPKVPSAEPAVAADCGSIPAFRGSLSSGGSQRLNFIVASALRADATVVPSGATFVVKLSKEVQLGNKGGILTLLDSRGLKIDGVSYTKEQAEREGWTIVF